MPAPHAFVLGIACGLALLVITAFRPLSPAWLKLLLIACGLTLMARYLLIAFPREEIPARVLDGLRLTGLWLPYAFGLDQLIRHPAMTPKKLLRWCLPVLLLPFLLPVAWVECAAGLALAGLTVLLLLKLPALRRGLAAFLAGALCFSLAGWSFAAELAALLLLWSVFDTAYGLQQQPMSL